MIELVAKISIRPTERVLAAENCADGRFTWIASERSAQKQGNGSDVQSMQIVGDTDTLHFQIRH